MKKVWRCYQLDSGICEKGLRWFLQVGERVEFDGRPYVKIGDSLHPHGREFAETRGAALLLLADHVDSVSERLREQACELRKQAERGDEVDGHGVQIV